MEKRFVNRVLSLLLIGLLAAHGGQGQSVRKQEARATNRSHIRLVDGDTVQLVALAKRERGRPHRQRHYYWYAQGRVQHAQGDVQGRRLHGPYRLLTREGQPLRQGQFRRGLKTGRWQSWYANGQRATLQTWRRGHPHGSLRAYDETGHRLPAAETAGARRRWWQWPRRLWSRRPAPPITPPTLSAPANGAEVPSASLGGADAPKATRKTRRAAKKQARQAAPLNPAGQLPPAGSAAPSQGTSPKAIKEARRAARQLKKQANQAPAATAPPAREPRP